MSVHDVDDVFGEFERTSNSAEENDFIDSNLSNGRSDMINRKRSKNEKQSETLKTRKLTKNQQLKLDPNRICGPRGITAVTDNFKHVKLQVKGHEKSNLEIILSQMEHWAHRLFPKLSFDDCVENVAKLGNTKSVQVYMKRFRMGMLDTEPENGDAVVNTDVQHDSITEKETDEFNAMMSLSSQSITQISKDQQNRMAENKRRAEEKRHSRLMQNISHSDYPCSNESSNILADLNPMSHETYEVNQKNLELLDIDTFLGSLP